MEYQFADPSSDGHTRLPSSVGSMFGKGGDTEAGAQRELDALQDDRSVERSQQFGRGERGGGCVSAGQQDGELVAAQARDGVRGAHTGSKAGADFLEQSVAGLMAERVVDFLEAIQVEY